MALAQPCYPIQVAHGHVLALIELGVDYVLLPNILDAESNEDSTCTAHFCPWNQTLPYVLRSAPRLEEHAAQVPGAHAALPVGPRRGQEGAGGNGAQAGRHAQAPSDQAVDAAYAAQREFQERLLEAGRRALATLDETGEPGLVLVGRGYNIYDRNINCDIPRKLRHRYGANVIPLDFLVTGQEHIGDLHPNMYWASGQKILAAARHGRHPAEPAPDLHLELQVRAGLLHQALHARGRRRAAAGAAVRRARQRRRLHDALRSLPRQQRNSAMLSIGARKPKRPPASIH